MEKRRPHYPLEAMQSAIARLGAEAFTRTALDGGWAMGLTVAAMLDVVAKLTVRGNFYKSMTTHADHKIWQDVYRAETPTGVRAYIKLTQVNERPVIQFKEE